MSTRIGKLLCKRPAGDLELREPFDDDSPFVDSGALRLLTQQVDRADRQHAISELESLLDETSPFEVGRGYFAHRLASLRLEEFKVRPTDEDAHSIIELFRSICRAAGPLEPFAADYELARAHYEVGRRMGNAALLASSVRNYQRAVDMALPMTRTRRRVKRNLREAIVEAYRVGWTPQIAYDERPSIAEFVITLDSVPVEKSCLERRFSRPWNRDRALFYSTVAGLDARIRFVPTSRKSAFDRIDSRGRELTGAVMATWQIGLHETNALRLELSFNGTGEEFETHLRSNAYDIRHWGNKVSSWLDVVSQQSRSDGITHGGDYLYGHIYSGTSSRWVQVPASRDQTNMAGVRLTEALSRHQIAHVLDHLSAMEVPVAFELLARADLALGSRDPLGALVAAGTAAEAALATALDSTAPGTRQPKWTLGRLAREALAVSGSELSSRYTQVSIENTLVRPRNDAVHRGQSTVKAATDAVALARELVHVVFDFESNSVANLTSSVHRLAPISAPYTPPRTGYSN